jgi:hypothetical protein
MKKISWAHSLSLHMVLLTLLIVIEESRIEFLAVINKRQKSRMTAHLHKSYSEHRLRKYCHECNHALLSLSIWKALVISFLR